MLVHVFISLSFSLSLSLSLSTHTHTQISFEVFLAGYSATSKANGYPDDLPNTHEFRQCMYDFFIDLRGEKIFIGLNGFLRAYNLTMRYVRGLKMIEEVIEGILDLPLTEQCQSALMKMTYCSQCAGYKDELLPCQGLCMNTLRGCFVDYVDLIKPIQEMSNALAELNKVIERNFNPWNQITLLNSYFSRTATETQGDIVTIRQDVSSWFVSVCVCECDCVGRVTFCAASVLRLIVRSISMKKRKV